MQAKNKNHALRGAIRFFMGDRNNIAVKVQDKEGLKPCGAIYLNEEILKEFKEILGEENVKFNIKNKIFFWKNHLLLPKFMV